MLSHLAVIQRQLALVHNNWTEGSHRSPRARCPRHRFPGRAVVGVDDILEAVDDWIVPMVDIDTDHARAVLYVHVEAHRWCARLPRGDIPAVHIPQIAEIPALAVGTNRNHSSVWIRSQYSDARLPLAALISRLLMPGVGSHLLPVRLYRQTL